jgi:hypothetical protein
MTEARSHPRTDDPSAFQHQFVEANGIRIHYVEEGTGALVLLLHGFLFLWYRWRNQIRPLADAGYRVVVRTCAVSGRPRGLKLRTSPCWSATSWG